MTIPLDDATMEALRATFADWYTNSGGSNSEIEFARKYDDRYKRRSAAAFYAGRVTAPSLNPMIAELAREAAILRHYEKVKRFDCGNVADAGGHATSENSFELCSHPDCALMRSVKSNPYVEAEHVAALAEAAWRAVLASLRDDETHTHDGCEIDIPSECTLFMLILDAMQAIVREPKREASIRDIVEPMHDVIMRVDLADHKSCLEALGKIDERIIDAINGAKS